MFKNPPKWIPFWKNESPPKVELKDVDSVFEALNEGHCPDCDGQEFIKGPSAGIASNVKCKCGSKFNIAYMDGNLLFAERI